MRLVDCATKIDPEQLVGMFLFIHFDSKLAICCSPHPNTNNFFSFDIQMSMAQLLQSLIFRFTLYQEGFNI
jgi:hypothetical protein